MILVRETEKIKDAPLSRHFYKITLDGEICAMVLIHCPSKILPSDNV
jgi:hypothetical protein